MRRFFLLLPLLAVALHAQVYPPAGASGQGGSGTVTSVSGLSPLFTTSNPSTTPTFALSSASAFFIFGNCTPSSGVPTYCAITPAMIPTLNQNTTGTAGNVTGLIAVANGGTGTTTPSLVAGSNVTITGAWPNQTISSTATGGTGTVTTSGSPTSGTLAAFSSSTAVTSATSPQIVSALNSNPSTVLSSSLIPVLNQNTTGTAANVTATTNSTLATLPALSLPSSQITGLGSAATTNSTAYDPSGAAFTAANNVLQYACGITIGDGANHTVGNAPAGSCFYGLTTLAQIAGITINGVKPFYFLTDSGTITGPLCTYGSTTNCFTSGTGAYQLTDSKATSLDIAWLAIQAALLTRNAYIPARTTSTANNGYQIGTSLPLPLMIPIASEADGNNLSSRGDLITGDGGRSSVLFAGSSFGQLSDGVTNIPLMSCGDPGATPTNTLGRWGGSSGQCYGQIRGIGLWGSNSLANGLSSTYHTDGLALGARLATTDVESSWFYRDVTLVGDHTLHIRLHANSGVYGIQWAPPNTSLGGDMQFTDLAISGQSYASIEVDGATGLNAFFDGETYLNAGLYAIYGENNGCSPILAGAHFRNLMTEYLGLGVIEDGHNFNVSTMAYNDASKCRNVQNFDTDHWFVSYSNSSITGSTGGGRRRRATIDASTLDGHIKGVDVNGGTLIPVADNTGAAGIAIFNINGVGASATGIGIELEGELENIFTSGVGSGVSGATVPVFPVTASGGQFGITGTTVSWANTGGDRGIFAALQVEGTYTSTVLGDLMEYQSGTYGTAVPAGYSANQPVMGVVSQSGLTNGMVMPLQQSGLALVAAGYHYGNDGFQKKSTGIGGRTTFVGGSGGTNGSYNVTATGGGCSSEPSYTVTVSGGAITAVTSPNSTSPTGCTSTPTVSTSSITGLSGGSITPQWPAAGETTASGPQDGIIFSYGLHASNGSTSAGTDQSYSRLIGIQ